MKTIQRLRPHWLLLGALVVGLLVRIPGIFWGANFPTGWAGHHIDEGTHVNMTAWMIHPYAMNDPATHPGYPHWNPRFYPTGIAAHVVVVQALAHVLRGRFSPQLPAPEVLLVTGRAISVLYGVASIVLVYLLARMLVRERPAVANLAAWIFALGGLHVSQSHFFLADVPALFWTLLGLYLIGRSVEGQAEASPHLLNVAALGAGVAFGMKLVPLALPSLVIACLLFRGRWVRLCYAGAFFTAGFCLVTLASYGPEQLLRTLERGSAVMRAHKYEYSRLAGAGIYLLELPRLVSLPVAVLGVVGALVLGARLPRRGVPALRVALVVLVPNAIQLVLVLFGFDNFPRHLVPFIPWLSISTAWLLVWLSDFARRPQVALAWLALPFLAYLAVFVFDGERIFWNEPRNPAARWLLDHVPEGTTGFWMVGDRSAMATLGLEYTEFPGTPLPDLIILEMHYANWFLSGMSWRDSYPKDHRNVFPWFTEESLPAFQALFRGTSRYSFCARFPEGYFMPEYVWIDRWIGNRARNYVAEVVIFRRDDAAIAPELCTGAVEDSNRR